ncbi:MAG: peptidoglycan editing factor PgeF [Ignavibacteria bacterium]|nr:peptidoglycan editing factor PgeF [Ignavibacteria bacterium]
MRLEVIKPEIFSKYKDVFCAVSTRIGGVSEMFYDLNLSYRVGDSNENVRMNRKIFFNYLKIDESRLVFQNQIHGSNSFYTEKSAFIINNDALYTDKRNLYLCLTIADCLPVFLYHPGGIIAAIHSGWRGSHLQIAYKTVIKICKHFAFDASELTAYIGPGLSAENFEVGREVAELFDRDVIRNREGKYFFDNKLENKNQLVKAGVKEINIEVSEYCTFKEKKLFHSYRRDGNRAGRMLGLIGLRG